MHPTGIAVRQSGSCWLVAAALRLPLIVSPPFLSTDVYRYVWDGRVQAAGINPYRYLPADPALLRCAMSRSIRGSTGRNMRRRSIRRRRRWCSPPSAYGLVQRHRREGGDGRVRGPGGLLPAALLAAAELPAERVLIYAWNPLPVWAFAGNGHVDAVVIGLVAAALLLRVRHRDGWAGVALGRGDR